MAHNHCNDVFAGPPLTLSFWQECTSPLLAIVLSPSLQLRHGTVCRTPSCHILRCPRSNVIWTLYCLH